LLLHLCVLDGGTHDEVVLEASFDGWNKTFLGGEGKEPTFRRPGRYAISQDAGKEFGDRRAEGNRSPVTNFLDVPSLV
jgi:hypothetical protein